ncbi:MAG: CRISPR-associated protein Cas2 [Hydrogenophilales bacterium CG18_big_fil_WC_8_21_14_2_50_58_12]|nr:MAG: CRISPR-associated protein Cas2 [Hydrogenophilales bacterium CG18_big_fil_WC_8_21_14_2_50_58_12]
MRSGAFVIGYDIAQPRRLQQVHRAMCKYAAPLEYSIFILVGNEEDKSRCMAEMAKLIEVGEDDVRCYPLPARGFQCRIGLTSLPEGIQWTGLPAAIA